MKWIVRLAGLLCVCVLALVALVVFLPADRIAKIATDQLRATTGRDVSIKGDVALTFWPILGLRAGDLEVGNASWAEQGPMLQATHAAIGVDVMSLLGGHIRITNIEADSPTIRLEQRLDGRASWQFTDASGGAQIETSTEPSRTPRSVSIERLSVTDATLIYDAEGSDLVSYEGVDLTLDWPDRNGPADIEASMRPASDVVSVTASIDGFAQFITGEVQTLTAQVSTGAGRLSLDGRANTAGAVAGAFALVTQDTGAFLSSLGLPSVDLPEALGRSIDLATQITLTPDRQLALRDLIVDLGGNRLTGAADISLNGTPRINAQLDAGNLNLRSATATATAGSGDGGGNASTSDSWPTQPIDASALASFDGDIALTAQSIDLGRFELGKTQAVLRNQASRMVFELRDVAAYQGRVTGEFVINNRNGLSVGGAIDARGIEMQPFLADAIDLDRLTGQADARASFLGSGGSVQSIMNNLSGDGSLTIAKGTVEGINLDQLLRSGDMGSGTTIFDNLGATWVIAGGVLRNDDLLFQLKNYEASGEGVVGLGAQTVDYTFTPVALRANSGAGLAIPVRFVGPWSNVSIRPDLEAALDLELDAQKDELEKRAREELSDRLGLDANDTSTEEIKRKATDKLLRKLFD